MIRDRSRSAAASVLPAPGHRLQLDAEIVLDTYPGPAVLLDPLGRVVSANAAGAALADRMRDGRGDELHEAVSAALADHSAAAREVTLAAGAEDSVALDVALLPLTTSGGAARVLLLGRETTVERGFIDALVESRRLFRDLVNASSDFAWETDADGKFTFVSTRGAIGYTARELNGRRAYDLLAEGQPEPEVFPFDARIPLDDCEVWLAARDGSPACLLVTCVPATDAAGGFRGARGVAKDVTQARARDAALRRAENRARMLGRIMEAIRNEVAPADMLAAATSASADALGAAHCWTLRGDPGGFAVASRCGDAVPAEVESSVCRIADRARHGAVQQAAAGGLSVLAAAAAYRGRVNGAIAVARASGGPAFDDDDRSLLAEVADRLAIALEQVANTELLERLSRTDELTGLLNRRAFFDEVSRRLAHQDRTGRSGALMYVDIDNFKPVNDILGHGVGDQVLRAVAEILGTGSRVGDIIARLGGDEFALWIEESDASAAAAKASLILEAARALAGRSPTDSPPLGLSIGVAVSRPGESLDALLPRADDAMYQAKRGGKGRVAVSGIDPEQ